MGPFEGLGHNIGVSVTVALFVVVNKCIYPQVNITFGVQLLVSFFPPLNIS